MKRTTGERIFNVCNISVLVLICVITLFPYLNQLAISLNDGNYPIGGLSVIPRKFTLESYKAVFTNQNFLDATVVSVARVVLSTVLSLFVCFAAAYGLTRKNLPYKRGLTLVLMIPAYISAGVIPVYILYRYLHLINNFWVYILPGAFVFYNMVIIRSFLQEMPESLEESAKLDGATDFQIMCRIIFPLSLPVVATVALWVAVGAWNDWTSTLMYITNRKLYPLQYLMMQLIKENEVAQKMTAQSAMSATQTITRLTPDSVKAATLIVTTLPIILVYPFLQKYFIKGVTLGAVKG